MTCATLKVATPKIFSPGNYAVNYIWAVRINFVCWLFMCPPYKRKGSEPLSLAGELQWDGINHVVL